MTKNLMPILEENRKAALDAITRLVEELRHAAKAFGQAVKEIPPEKAATTATQAQAVNHLSQAQGSKPLLERTRRALEQRLKPTYEELALQKTKILTPKSDEQSKTKASKPTLRQPGKSGHE